MGLELIYAEGQTPLDDDEKEGLLLPFIITRGELDDHEQRNIEGAIRWTMERRKKFTADEVLSEDFVRQLHVHMFGNVWKWAGNFRNTNKNIGVDKYQVPTELRMLLDDCRYWIAEHIFGPDEIALRFKHRLVSIHCFPNGNGRHSRLMADVIAEKILGHDFFSWGSRLLAKQGTDRKTYLNALRAADQGDISLLLEFARS